MPSHRVPVRCAIRRLGLIDYSDALEAQRRAIDRCRASSDATLLLLEHPPTYTLGARANAGHLHLDSIQLMELGASVYRSDRGGDVTFHGPGQLVGYPILNLKDWGQGPLWYVRSLEETLIRALAKLDIDADRRPGFPGVWTGGAKIASIGVHVSRGVTSHGFSLNVDPDLRYFEHIVACGLEDIRITSIRELTGQAPSMDNAMDMVEREFVQLLGVQIGRPVLTVGVA